MVWIALVLLPQPSVAIHFRYTILPPPHKFDTVSLEVTIGTLHASCAVATPVELVLVSAGHWRVRFGGMDREGEVVSCTVMVWVPLVLLPHGSAAVQVREITLAPEQGIETASWNELVTAPQQQLWAVATPVEFVLVSAGH